MIDKFSCTFVGQANVEEDCNRMLKRTEEGVERLISWMRKNYKTNILNKKTLVLTCYLVFLSNGKMLDIITLDNEFS